MNPSKSGRVLRNTGFATVAEIGAKIATFALLAVIARELGDREFGEYVLAFSVASLAVTLADWGHDRVLTREVARRPETLPDYFGNTLALRAVIGSALVLLVVVFAPTLGYEEDLRTIFLLAGFAAITDLLSSTCFAVFQAFQRLGFLPIVLVSQRWLTAIAGIAAVVLGASITVVVALYLVFSVGSLLVAVTLIHRHVAPVRLRVDPSRWIPMIRRAAPFGVAGLFGVVLFRIDMAMLGAMSGERAVGDYAAAYRMLEVTLFLAFSIGTAVYPVYSRRTRSSDPPVGEVYARSLKLGLAATVPIAVGFAILAAPLLETLFGSSFHRADDALIVLAPAVAFFPVSYLSGYLLVSQDRERTLLVVSGVVAAGNVVANAIAIPRWSLMGAAVNTTVFEGLAVVLTVMAAQRSCGPIVWTRVMAAPFVATACAAVPMVLLDDSFAAAAAAGAAVYVSVLLAIEHRFHPDDFDAFRSLVRMRRGEPLVEPRGAA